MSAGFFDHIVDCDDCWATRDIGKLCAIGEELLFEENDLPAQWQATARRIHERQIREKEAEANFEYYKGCDEP